MKRNEEYQSGEVFCSSPFFVTNNNRKTYRLIGKLADREQSIGNGAWYRKWGVVGVLDNLEYHLWTRECDIFEKEDF